MKNNSIRCDKCGKLTRDRDGYYRKPDGSSGYINGRGYNISQDYCDECAEVLGEIYLYNLEGDDNHASSEPPN